MGCKLEYHQEEELSKCWGIKPGKFSFEKITMNVPKCNVSMLCDLNGNTGILLSLIRIL